MVTVGRNATHTKVMNVRSKWPELSYVSITMLFTNLTERRERQVSGGGGGGEVRDMMKGRVRKREGKGSHYLRCEGKATGGKGMEREWWRKIIEVTRLLKGGGDEEDGAGTV